LRGRLGGGLLGHDLIAFCDSRSWGSEMHVHFLMSEDHVDPAAARAVFGHPLT
jgi:hypothetical protein